MRVLVACEESGRVTSELLALGVDAYSCDLLPTSGDHPERHIQGDVTPLLSQHWDLIIAFPPCTFLTVTGNRWFNIPKYGDKARQRWINRREAVKFFMMFANADCEHIAIENPLGVMSTIYRKPNQIIQPWQFGDAYEKKTCLWLKGLPCLKSTEIVTPPARRVFDSGKSLPTWFADSWGLPKEERAKMRSKTFPGIAKAMATQWVEYLKKEVIE